MKFYRKKTIQHQLLLKMPFSASKGRSQPTKEKRAELIFIFATAIKVNLTRKKKCMMDWNDDWVK